jgi:hypothetical protein
MTNDSATTTTSAHDASALAYERLGFALPDGEPPPARWARMRDATSRLIGPLSPDCWAGLCFVADHEDVFAFRLLVVPDACWDARDASAPASAWFEKWMQRCDAWWRGFGPAGPAHHQMR